MLWVLDALVITLNVADSREQFKYQHEIFRQKFQNINQPQLY